MESPPRQAPPPATDLVYAAALSQLAPEQLRAAALRDRLRFHAERLPRWRAAWGACLAVVVGVHRAALGGAGDSVLLLTAAIFALGLAHAFVARWLVLRAGTVDAAVRRAEQSYWGDLLVTLVAVYASGGSASLALPALLGPSALQVIRRPKDALHLGLGACVGFSLLVALDPPTSGSGYMLDAGRLVGLSIAVTAIVGGAREVTRLRRRDGGALKLACTRATQFERQLAEARTERARTGAADRARGEILADLGHDIRTPMTSIIGLSELCLEGEDDPTRREHLRCVQGSAGSLLRTLDDLVDLSEFETGKVEVRELAFDLRALLADKLPALEARAYEQGLSLHCRVAPEVPRTLIGDGPRIGQIVGRLVQNAIRDTSSGSVAVRVDAGRDGGVVVRVIDTGNGYDADALDSLLNAPLGDQHGRGQGLGLPLVRRIVTALGGRLEAASAPSRGSEFRVVLFPRFPPGEPADVSPPGVGCRVLLAAADVVEGACLAELVAASGAAVEQWRGGGAVPDAAAVATGTPTLVIVDGAAVHSDPKAFDRLVETLPQHRVAVVASLADELTGAALRRWGGRVLRLERPVLSPPFEALLRDVATGQASERAGTPRPSTGAAADQTAGGTPSGRRGAGARKTAGPLRILLAEDDAANRRLFRAVLEGWGHRVHAVEDGEAAVKEFLERPFDVVLMDLQLPVIDGYEATARLRALSAAGADVPILALTSSPLIEEAERCAEVGMDGHLSKPIDLSDLFSWLEHQTLRRRGVA